MRLICAIIFMMEFDRLYFSFVSDPPTTHFITHVGRKFESVCLSVCLSIYLSVCPRHNSKTNDPKVFKLGTGNDLEIYYTVSEKKVNH